jgi:hypothetical protein
VRKANRSGNLLDPIARYKTMASRPQGRDVWRVVLCVTKRLAQVDDVKPKTAFFHYDIRTDPRQQIVLAHDIARTGHQLY